MPTSLKIFPLEYTLIFYKIYGKYPWHEALFFQNLLLLQIFRFRAPDRFPIPLIDFLGPLQPVSFLLFCCQQVLESIQPSTHQPEYNIQCGRNHILWQYLQDLVAY